jgi:hypothetical protein
VLAQLAKWAPKQMGITEKRQPDMQWALHALSTVCPANKYFKKSYFPSDDERRKSKTAKPEMMVDNNDDFFSNLPRPNRRRQPKGQSVYDKVSSSKSASANGITSIVRNTFTWI